VFWDIPYAALRGAARFASRARAGVDRGAGRQPARPQRADAGRRWFGRLDMGPVIRGWVPGEDYLTVNV